MGIQKFMSRHMTPGLSGDAKQAILRAVGEYIMEDLPAFPGCTLFLRSILRDCESRWDQKGTTLAVSHEDLCATIGRSLVQERRPIFFLKSACFATSACG